ncbi:hypothetical protein BDV96DRAFT_644093 [Lophiotrema nucula]|uniref:MHYT domain-containing protein n=1 Tax=Lophiotrema nucula TaxID=690887 RepID=A0A6A5ZE69_9PLEO|nr:hypothetical protein BDV96DRAFT_644093 [Lophiotrema nucula]
MDLHTKYPIGSRPSIHYLPYLIVISYIVSLIGAFTTVELLHRRISGSGWRTWVQLMGCSVSFGLVAIWCMHFVGNRAIILGDGEEEIQLYYSSTFTAISAVVPIVVIFGGLLVADRFHKGSRGLTTRYVALLACGVCSGAAITEMHYLGNNGTTDYHLKPSWGYVIGAAAIAIGAATISYTLFFHWSKHWINKWWRRLIVACVLATAVSGMHWTAAAGTVYELQGYHNGPSGGRNTNLIIAVCLCLAACSVCFALGFLKQRHAKKLKDRAQQVVLAIATFDAEGRLLVTQGGLMPCQTITRQFHQRTFDEDFNTSHPVFQWIFRVSRHWNGIVDLIPAMREHLQSTGYLQTHSPVIGSGSRSSMGSDDNTSYSATFRELFCVTAQEIARSLDTRLQDLGTLYEDVLTTGTLLSRMLWGNNAGAKTIVASDVAHSDLESGIANPILFGKGQLLVMTRKVGTDEANRLQNKGYRFASLDQVGEMLARSLQISREDLNLMVARLQLFCERRPWTPSRGTYLAAFILQPSPVMKGLDVIVPRLTPDRLPMVKLASDELNDEQLRTLKLCEGRTLEECLTRIRQGAGTGDDVWLEKFRNKIHELMREVPESALRKATFSARPLSATHGFSGQNDVSEATVFAFCGIKDVYNQTLQSRTLRHVPLSLFQCYQRIYPGCPDHAILAQKNHKEFGSLLSSTIESSPSSPRSPKKWWPFVRQASVSESSINPDSSSEKGLFGISHYTSADSTNNTSAHPFGGIMVSQEVVINNDNQKMSSQMELSDLGVRSEAGVADQEQQTLADKLVSITTAMHDPQARPVRDHHGRR